MSGDFRLLDMLRARELDTHRYTVGERAADEIERLQVRLTEAERIIRAVTQSIRMTDLMQARFDCGFELDQAIDKWLAEK